MTDIIVNSLGGWSVYLIFAAALILVIKGGDWFVDGASRIAEASGVPKFIIGATIVSVATTLPELIVSSIGAANGTPEGTDLAIGNAIGSVTANTGLILAVGLLFMPSVIKRKELMPKALMFLGAIALLFVLSLDGRLTVLESVLLFLLFAAFIGENIHQGKNGVQPPQESAQGGIASYIALFVLGTVCIVIGSNFLIESGTLIAEQLHVPDRIVGLTMVAIGTSLPELVTTVTAIVKKESSLSVGNIVGANVIDTALILPICAAIKGGALPVAANTLYIDIPVCFGIAALAMIPTFFTKKFQRWQGVALICGYAAYLITMIGV